MNVATVFLIFSLLLVGFVDAVTYPGNVGALTKGQQELKKTFDKVGKIENPTLKQLEEYNTAFPNVFPGIKTDNRLRQLLAQNSDKLVLQFGIVSILGSQNSAHGSVDLTVISALPKGKMGQTMQSYFGQGAITLAYNADKKLALMISGFTQKNPALLANGYVWLDHQKGKLLVKLTPLNGQPRIAFPDSSVTLPQGGVVTEGACPADVACVQSMGKGYYVLGEAVISSGRTSVYFSEKPPKIKDSLDTIPQAKDVRRGVEVVPSRDGWSTAITKEGERGMIIKKK